MTQAELDRLCAEANLRLRDFIARCAGQHLSLIHTDAADE